MPTLPYHVGSVRGRTKPDGSKLYQASDDSMLHGDDHFASRTHLQMVEMSLIMIDSTGHQSLCESVRDQRLGIGCECKTMGKRGVGEGGD